jgi:hypothetical protein
MSDITAQSTIEEKNLSEKITVAQRLAFLRNKLQISDGQGQQTLIPVSNLDNLQNKAILPVWEQVWPQSWEQTWIQPVGLNLEEEESTDYI